MEAINFFEKSAPTYHTRWRYNPQNLGLPSYGSYMKDVNVTVVWFFGYKKIKNFSSEIL